VLTVALSVLICRNAYSSPLGDIKVLSTSPLATYEGICKIDYNIYFRDKIHTAICKSCLMQHPLKMVTCRNNVCNINTYISGHPKLYVATLKITN
jgi:hypothetical protein